MKNKFTVIVTVGPSTFEESQIIEIYNLGNCIFRINGAHVDAAETKRITSLIRHAVKDPTIMVDLPGNKVRTHNLSKPIKLVKGEAFELQKHEFNYPSFGDHLKPGDKVYANDSIYEFEVLGVTGGTVKFKSLSDGPLLNNKGMHVHGIHEEIPFLFDHDKELIAASLEENIDIISLSFVRNADDIKTVKKIIEENGRATPELFAKVETAAAVDNLAEIFEEVDTINVDRGDLSTDVGILKIANITERIVQSAKRAEKRVFLATQFLKYMEENPIPTISEIACLHDAVRSGISGVQLSEETAVGKHPVNCVKLVFDVYKNSFSGY
jgi:pyruvate kinase